MTSRSVAPIDVFLSFNLSNTSLVRYFLKSDLQSLASWSFLNPASSLSKVAWSTILLLQRLPLKSWETNVIRVNTLVRLLVGQMKQKWRIDVEQCLKLRLRHQCFTWSSIWNRDAQKNHCYFCWLKILIWLSFVIWPIKFIVAKHYTHFCY